MTSCSFSFIIPARQGWGFLTWLAGRRLGRYLSSLPRRGRI
nr:MAG TPA: hypothetical protein [Caudoviricetes sp.]